MGYMPFGGSGAPLLRLPEVNAVADAVSGSADRPITTAQLLVQWIRLQGVVVCFPRS
eukprot:SAG31_NODE_4166_length_3518_cov_2.348055_4_plen_57_part_00